MAIEEMVLLNMTFDCQELDEVLFQLKDSTYFYPQTASKIVNNVEGVHILEKNHIYSDLKDRLIQDASDMKLDLTSDLEPEHTLNVDKVQTYFKELEVEIKKIKDIENQLIVEKEENEVTLQMLHHLSLSKVDLDQIKNCQYVVARFGRFQKQHLAKLNYYEGRPFIFNKLGEDHQYVWCCYIVTKSLLLEVDNIFQALGFREIEIPSFVHGTLEDAKKELKNEIHAMDEYIMRMEQKMTILRETHKVDLLKIYSTIHFLKRIEEYKIYVVDYENKYAIYGFLSKRHIKEFQEHFKDIKSIEYKQLPNDILDQQDVVAPVVVHNAKIVRPFEMLSKVKQSDKIDVTIAFAILYYAVFIIFLGDLAVGALMLGLGLLFRKKEFGKLLLSLSIAAIVGGVLYGSLFYVKNLYTFLAFPLNYRLVDGIILLGIETYTIRCIQRMAIEDTIIDKVLSLKGICGIISIYAVMIYLICHYEVSLSTPMMPFAIVVAACLMLIVFKSTIKKKFVK